MQESSEEAKSEMDVVLVVVIAFGVWSFVFALVLGMCRAAAEGDGASNDQMRYLQSRMEETKDGLPVPDSALAKAEPERARRIRASAR